jgi:hypothetical protein
MDTTDSVGDIVESTRDEEQIEDEFDSFYGCNDGAIDFLGLPVDIIYELFELFTDKDLVRYLIAFGVTSKIIVLPVLE